MSLTTYILLILIFLGEIHILTVGQTGFTIMMQPSKTYTLGVCPIHFSKIFLLRLHSPKVWKHGRWLFKISTVYTKALTSWNDPLARWTRWLDAQVRWLAIPKQQGAATTSQSAHVMVSLQTSVSAMPMDVNLRKSWPETCKCYNCQKIGHLANNCLEPHKQHAQNNFSEMDILDLVAKAVTTALNEWDKRKEVKEEAKTDFWHSPWWKTHPVWSIISQSWKLVQ